MFFKNLDKSKNKQTWVFWKLFAYNNFKVLVRERFATTHLHSIVNAEHSTLFCLLMFVAIKHLRQNSMET